MNEFVKFFFRGIEIEHFINQEIIVGIDTTTIGVFGEFQPVGLEVEQLANAGDLTGAHGVGGNDPFGHGETLFIEVFVVDDSNSFIEIPGIHPGFFMALSVLFMMSGFDHRSGMIPFGHGW